MIGRGYENERDPYTGFPHSNWFHYWVSNRSLCFEALHRDVFTLTLSKRFRNDGFGGRVG
jgi:hypothetical protein